jgi:hypothetical protein
MIGLNELLVIKQALKWRLVELMGKEFDDRPKVNDTTTSEIEEVKHTQEIVKGILDSNRINVKLEDGLEIYILCDKKKAEYRTYGSLLEQVHDLLGKKL